MMNFAQIPILSSRLGIYVLGRKMPNAFIGAWSTRRVFDAYTGYLAQVRRTSDDATTDVATDSLGYLSGSSLVSAGGDLTTWLGGSGFTFVTLYHQMPDNAGTNHATQITNSAQPSGSLTAGLNSYAELDFDGSDDSLSFGSVFTHSNGHVFAISKTRSFYPLAAVRSAGNIERLIFNNATVGVDFNGGPRIQYGNVTLNIQYNEFPNASATSNDSTWYYCNFWDDGSVHHIRRNGGNEYTLANSYNFGSGTPASEWFVDANQNDLMDIGAVRSSTAIFQAGQFMELIVTNAVLSSADYQFIEQKQGNF